jgi:hypothetical protein
MDPIEQEIEDRIRRREAARRHPQVQQSIAQLRLALDEREGRETPQWIRDLAKQPLPPRGR